jgi:hypothetical protein
VKQRSGSVLGNHINQRKDKQKMEKKAKDGKAYVRPELRRVELSIAEVTLGTGCWGFGGTDPTEIGDCQTLGTGCNEA